MDPDKTFLQDLDAFLENSPINVVYDESEQRWSELDTAPGFVDSLTESGDSQSSSCFSDRDCLSRSARRAKESKRRQVYRQRLTEERNSLPQEVRKLSMELEQLRERINTTAGPNPTTAQIWRNVAIAELEGRQRAEDEFQRLVCDVSTHTQLIGDLGRLMRLRIERVGT
ncbi:hypothetical protein GN958_ATG16092 [Phytophthora infestans]|nr:hypothetical protein GN958_ATG16092 [Phytophthora infestans]